MGSIGWDDALSPFPGLWPFESRRRRAFFGRAAEVAELSALRRSPTTAADRAVLVVVGPSGCGKSSLVRAGLVPAMADEDDWWTLTPFLPGSDPMTVLAGELAISGRRFGLSWTVGGVRGRLEAEGLTSMADELLVCASTGAGRRRHMLVVVDQLEELLTQTPVAARARFAELMGLAQTSAVRIVATLRPESLPELLASPELARLPLRPIPLRPLNREGLRSVIEGPARLAGIGVDPVLVERLVEDTGSGEALPLLAFTLAQLAESVRRGDRLSARRYEDLGASRAATQQARTASFPVMRTATVASRGATSAARSSLPAASDGSHDTPWPNGDGARL
jgi:energy-coupling factor transporter ATP-binding protein EcfA2